jgi:L-asparaginase/Glu-tRNA(Gln) amidotransferase subunit D
VLLAASQEAVGKGVLVAMNDQITAPATSPRPTPRRRQLQDARTGHAGLHPGQQALLLPHVARKHTVDTEFDVSKLSALPQVDIFYGYANVNPVALMRWWPQAPRASSTPAWATAAWPPR